MWTEHAAGSHTFGVRATDSVGNLSSTTVHTWTVDVGVPDISSSFPNAGRAYSDPTFAAGCGTPSGDLCGTASDAQGSITSVAVSIQQARTSLFWNGAGFTSSSEVFIKATGTTSWSYALAPASFPEEGSYALRARATDNVGLTGFNSVTFTIDRTAPTAPAITAGPTGTTAGGDTFSFTGEPGAGFECRLDADSWSVCSSPKVLGSLNDGPHSFAVRGVDAAGNAGPATDRTWTVDAMAPAIGTTFPVSGARYGATTYNAGCVPTTGEICGTASDAASGVAKVEVSVQRASTGLYLTATTFGAVSQNWITATGTTSWSSAIAATTFSTDGTYTGFVRATDTVGNVATTSTAFIFDKTKPTAAGFSTTNVSNARRLEAGDAFTLTYSEAVNPSSIIAGWNGATTQNIVVKATNSGTNDKLTVYASNGTTQLPLGTVALKRGDYVTGAMTFGLTGTASTLSMSGTSLTIRLGTPSGTPTTAAAAANATWTPSALVTDLAGNAGATTVYTETDLDNDF